MAIQTVPYEPSHQINMSGEKPFYEGDAFFKVGDSCFSVLSNEFVMIVGGYWLHNVREGKNVRAARWGYLVESVHDREKYFCAAGDLLDADYRPRHIRLVPVAAKAKGRPRVAGQS